LQCAEYRQADQTLVDLLWNAGRQFDSSVKHHTIRLLSLTKKFFHGENFSCKAVRPFEKRFTKQNCGWSFLFVRSGKRMTDNNSLHETGNSFKFCSRMHINYQ
jgi:hypothetical protein